MTALGPMRPERAALRAGMSRPAAPRGDVGIAVLALGALVGTFLAFGTAPAASATCRAGEPGGWSAVLTYFDGSGAGGAAPKGIESAGPGRVTGSFTVPQQGQ